MFAGADTADASGVSVTGLAVPFGVPANIGAFTERFSRDAFAEDEKAGFKGITSQFMHDGVFLLGSVDGRSLQLTQTPAGLVFTLKLPASAGYVAELVARQDVAGASVSFVATDDEWDWAVDGEPMRTVKAARLLEVSLVSKPAYPTTSVQIAAGPTRSAPVAPASGPAPVLSMEEAGRQLRAREARMNWERMTRWRERIIDLDIERTRYP